MLVLSRRLDEKIVLPTVPAIIKVISTQSSLVRLGVEAPSHVPILREELTRSGRASQPRSSPNDANANVELPSLPRVLQEQVNGLLLDLTLLRVQLVECGDAVRKTLDGLESKLQNLRGQVLGSVDPNRAT